MHEIPSLKYKYSDLEPYIDEETMRIHHTKHHQSYVDKLNTALERYPDLGKKSVAELLLDINLVAEDIRQTVINNGGGHYNHTLFWEMIGPVHDQKPRENTITLFEQHFGNFDGFRQKFKESAMARFGSGWAWLVINKGGKPEIINTPNQDSPIMAGFKILLGVDVWEHAYYLKYQNRRAEYLDAFWHVVNWEKVEELLSAK